MTFKFIDYAIPSCEQINNPTGRLYKTPDGNLYPSVTTVLGSIPSPELDAWKLAVGEAEAKKISKSATVRGEKIHKWCEDYLRGNDTKMPMLHREAYEMYLAMVPYLNKFSVIHALETRLWSDKLKVAGSVDCIAEIDGEVWVIDFKTSGRYKTIEEIHSYFMQTSAYAYMFWERTGIAIKKMRIIITTQDDGVLVYDELVKDWLPEFMKVRASFL